MTSWFAGSVDLEPNKDGSFTGVEDAMEWFDSTVPRGTVYATYDIATEMPQLLARLNESHEVGVHVHPREFGHEHDQLAELDRDRQRELIARTRTAVADAVDTPAAAVTAFRAGRHSASEVTFEVLAELGFSVDASININYTKYLPERLRTRQTPFELAAGLLEVPTTFGRPPLCSTLGLRTFPGRTFTATANTLRTDTRGTTGLTALQWLLDAEDGVSFYFHPYDATSYHADLENGGEPFRQRLETLLERFDGEFRSAGELTTERADKPSSPS